MQRMRISLILICCAFLAAFPHSAHSAETIDVDKATRVKAGYLFHLSRLTQWPPFVFDSHDSPLVIGVVGDDPHGLTRFFRDNADQLRAQQHPLRIEALRQLGPGDPVDRYHMLFFTATTREQYLQQFVAGLPPYVLTAGDYPEFCSDGGMVGFVLDEGRIRIHVNLDAVHEDSLKLSAEFLQHATIVGDRGGD